MNLGTHNKSDQFAIISHDSNADMVIIFDACNANTGLPTDNTSNYSFKTRSYKQVKSLEIHY